jgi:hypothetical protein
MMPPENKRNMDEWLKACADQRRREQGAPFELHPATREMLLAEAARACPAAGSSETNNNLVWLGRWWPRLAWGATVFAGSVFILLVLRAPNPPKPLPSSMPARSDQPLERAKPATSERSVAKAADETLLQPTAPAPVKESVRAMSPQDYAMAKALAPAAPMPAPTASPAPKDPETALVRRYGLAAPTSASAAKAKPSSELRRDKTAVALAMPEPSITQSQTENARQRFSNVDVRDRYRRNFNSPAGLPVLNSFELEQNGSQVRILDADGSVYEGRITPALAPQGQAGNRQTVSAPPAAARAQTARLVADPNAGLAQSSDNDASAAFYNFRAVGTNRTLNQRVVFSGNYQGTANAPSQAANNLASQTAFSAANNQAAAGTQMQSNQRRSQIGGGAQIQGQAFIGTNNQVEINALERPAP